MGLFLGSLEKMARHTDVYVISRIPLFVLVNVPRTVCEMVEKVLVRGFSFSFLPYHP